MLSERSATTLLAVIALAAACATGSRPTRRSDNTSSTVVTHLELARFGSQGTLMDALERVRPSMLVSRGTPPLVSVDGSLPAELSVLRAITASAVREVRMQRASSSVGHAAIARNGRVIVGDVIVVVTWPGPRDRR